ncbi:MAG: 50S ribosomal protein L25 [candidate division WOR-3 bacterium]
MVYKLNVEQRDKAGKSISKKLRKNGMIPAVVYGHGDEAIKLAVNEKEFNKLLEKIKGHSPIIDLQINDRPAIKAIIKTIQREPISKKFLSIDFQLIHAKEKITVDVPVVLKGTAIGIKQGGILDFPLRSIPIRCTVDNIPEHIEVDITNLKMGHSIHVADIKIEGIEFMLSSDVPIVSILTPKKVEVTAAVTEEIKEPEVITEKKKEEVAEESESSGKKKPSAEAETKK